MAIKVKPSAKQKALATVAQSTGPVVRTRSLSQAGLNDGEQLEFYNPLDWFESEEDYYSKPFVITKARLSTKGQFGNKVIFTLTEGDADGERSLVSLPADDSRLRYVYYFNQNTIGLGPCVFKKLDTGKAHPYYAIAEADEAGQENEDEVEF